jgi:hypothetical protein
MVRLCRPSSKKNLSLTFGRRYLDNFLTRPGPFTDPQAALGQETIDQLSNAKILYVTQVLEYLHDSD